MNRFAIAQPRSFEQACTRPRSSSSEMWCVFAKDCPGGNANHFLAAASW